jgi:hypothetical protein
LHGEILLVDIANHIGFFAFAIHAVFVQVFKRLLVALDNGIALTSSITCSTTHPTWRT